MSSGMHPTYRAWLRQSPVPRELPVEGLVVGLPGDAGEQAKLVELGAPVAVGAASEVDGEELGDEEQRMLDIGRGEDVAYGTLDEIGI